MKRLLNFQAKQKNCKFFSSANSWSWNMLAKKLKSSILLIHYVWFNMMYSSLNVTRFKSNLLKECLEMNEFSIWRNVERFDPYRENFNNVTNFFGIEFFLSKSKEFCKSHGSLLNVFDRNSPIIMELFKVIQRRREEVRFSL